MTLKAELLRRIETRKPDIRAGQEAFNALYELRPEIADLIRGSFADPFYVDGRLPDFWKALDMATGTGDGE